MRHVLTSNAPQPLGPYSQAIVAQNIVYVSGQLGIDPQNPTNRLSTAKQQAFQCLQNIAAILREAGSTINHLLKVTVYLTDLKQWQDVNTVYTDFVGDHRPARSVVVVSALPGSYLVEIDAIAAIK